MSLGDVRGGICVSGSVRQAEATQADWCRQCPALLLLRGFVF